MNLDDLAKLMGQMIQRTPEPQQGRSGQIPSEGANADQQLLQPIPPASSESNANDVSRTPPNQWPVSGSQQPNSDYQNMAAQMAIALAPLLMRGKVPTTDAINAPPGSDLRYSPQ